MHLKHLVLKKKPTPDQLRKEYISLVKYFHPDINQNETEATTEIVKELNCVLEIIKDKASEQKTFNPEDWTIEDYIYVPNDPNSCSAYWGYKGVIKLEGDGNLCEIGRTLSKFKTHNWDLELDGEEVTGYSSYADFFMTENYMINATEFLLRVYLCLTGENYDSEIVQHAGDWELEVCENHIEVSYIEPEEAGSGVEKLSKFPLEDIILIEQAIFGKSKLRKKLKKEMLCLKQ